MDRADARREIGTWRPSGSPQGRRSIVQPGQHGPTPSRHQVQEKRNALRANGKHLPVFKGLLNAPARLAFP